MRNKIGLLSIKMAVVGLGVLLAALASPASAQSSRAISLNGLVGDGAGDQLDVSATSDEFFPQNNNLSASGGNWFCYENGPDLASIFDFKINPTLSSVTLTFDTSSMACFTNHGFLPPATVTMSCNTNGQYFLKDIGNGSSNFPSGPGSHPVKFHITIKGNSVDCTGSADSRNYDVSIGGLLTYTQYVQH